MYMTAIVGPIAPYSNVPIHANYYQPSVFFISQVDLGLTTTVTTVGNHNYTLGQQVRLLIPPGYGCRQLNEMQGYVLSLPAANQVIVSINSANNVDTFIAAGLQNKPQILAIGNINSGLNTFIVNPPPMVTGSFINISPE